MTFSQTSMNALCTPHIFLSAILKIFANDLSKLNIEERNVGFSWETIRAIKPEQLSTSRPSSVRKRLDNMTKSLQTIEKITARVFCQMKGGGNPVTVFAASQGLASATQQRLSQTCDWESVMVDRHRRQLAFYMPTGEQVSFCAHAAMGGAMQLVSGDDDDDADDRDTSVKFFVPAQTNNTNNDKKDDVAYEATLHDQDIVSLQMTSPWTETPITYPPTLRRVLRDCFGLEASDLSSSLPTMCNVSIARPKTVVRVRSLEALQQIKVPPVHNDSFRQACDALDASTGIYLYTKLLNAKDDDDDEATKSFECRQFPRASGYPEDPATGIAAAALAASVDHRQLLTDQDSSTNMRYKFHQGTAMGQASLIMVEDLQWKRSTTTSEDDVVSFRLVGRVEVDQREIMEVPDEK